MTKFLKNLFNSIMTLGDKQEVEQKVLSDKERNRINQVTASQSQRMMTKHRGFRDKAHIGERKIWRTMKRFRKAAKRYCNNLNNPGSVGHNPRRHRILVARQMKQTFATTQG